MEAEAVRRRMQDLHTTQAARLRQELINTQQHELQMVLEMHQREEQRLAALWGDKVRPGWGPAAHSAMLPCAWAPASPAAPAVAGYHSSIV